MDRTVTVKQKLTSGHELGNKTLTDRQSQCDFDFDFALVINNWATPEAGSPNIMGSESYCKQINNVLGQCGVTR
jgi:hypothetical protein